MDARRPHHIRGTSSRKGKSIFTGNSSSSKMSKNSKSSDSVSSSGENILTSGGQHSGSDDSGTLNDKFTNLECEITRLRAERNFWKDKALAASSPKSISKLDPASKHTDKRMQAELQVWKKIAVQLFSNFQAMHKLNLINIGKITKDNDHVAARDRVLSELGIEEEACED